MDGNYYQNPSFNNDNDISNNNQSINENNYLETILNRNRGKVIKVYVTFPDNQNHIFSGIMESAGQGHLILKDPTNGKWNLILLYYLNYIEFEEAIY